MTRGEKRIFSSLRIAWCGPAGDAFCIFPVIPVQPPSFIPRSAEHAISAGFLVLGQWFTLLFPINSSSSSTWCGFLPIETALRSFGWDSWAVSTDWWLDCRAPFVSGIIPRHWVLFLILSFHLSSVFLTVSSSKLRLSILLPGNLFPSLSWQKRGNFFFCFLSVEKVYSRFIFRAISQGTGVWRGELENPDRIKPGWAGDILDLVESAAGLWLVAAYVFLC